MTQRYERINTQEDDAHSPATPNSPPPSFRSHASSLQQPESRRLISESDRELADTFDSPSDDEDDATQHQLDDRQRVMSGRPADRSSANTRPGTPTSPDGQPTVERRVTQLPAFSTTSTNNNRNNSNYGGNAAVHDGVFANLNAKPERNESDLEEKPPTYEQAAADATPPYWETTILTPSGLGGDNDVYIDGLPVGTFFSFVWNAMISMSFQLVGFLLTYLLHTTHAAKNGSKAGLGITLIQYGFGMKRDGSAGSSPNKPSDGDPGAPPGGDAFVPPPQDPNSHDFDPNSAMAAAGFVADAATINGANSQAAQGMRAADWFAYALMIVGWFILIRSISQYFKARRHEQLVLQSPSRGLNVPVVAEGEGERAA